jgi:type IV fimbrial biogenesis protein FimT
MVVAISIFAILVAMAVPTMRTWMMNSQLRAAADALQNGVRLARAESLSRSRLMVFALTASANPQAGFTAVGNGVNWAIVEIPAMTDGTDNPNLFVQSGALSVTNNLQVAGPPEICFNSVGRLVANNATGVPGANCTVPTVGITPGGPPKWVYLLQLQGADHQLQVEVGLGGQVHLCDPAQTLSNTNPYGC